MANISELLNGWGFGKQTAIGTANLVATIWRHTNLNTKPWAKVPVNEDDRAEIGKGHEFPTQLFKSHYNMPAYELSKYASSEFLAWAMRIEVEVGTDEQVQKAVAIVVGESATCAPLGFEMEQPGFLCDIGEGTVAVVAVENVLSPATDEEIVEAIVIVVAHTNTRCPHGTLQSGLLRHVGEGAVAVVFVQAVGGPGRGAGEQGTAGDKDVEPAVVIVVEKGDPAAVGLQDVFLLVGVAVNHGSGESRFRSDVGELKPRFGGGSKGEQWEAQKVAPSHLIPLASTAV